MKQPKILYIIILFTVSLFLCNCTKEELKPYNAIEIHCSDEVYFNITGDCTTQTDDNLKSLIVFPGKGPIYLSITKVEGSNFQGFIFYMKENQKVEGKQFQTISKIYQIKLQ